MSTAVTLQCPNCGGVFLTLQQGGGGMEICPHCAVAAPRGSYRRVDGQAAFPRARTALPARRTAPVHLAPQPVTGTGPVPTLGAAPAPPAVHAAPPGAEPATTHLPWHQPAVIPVQPQPPAATPPAPTAAPTAPFFAAPAPSASPFTPAVTASPVITTPPPVVTTSPLPPPQIGFAPAPEPTTTPTPFRTAATPQTRLMPSPGSIGFQRVEPRLPASPAPAVSHPPVWPGLGVEGSPAPIAAGVFPPPSARSTEDTPNSGWMEMQPSVTDGTPLLEKPRRAPWLSLLFLLSLACGLALAMWKSSQPRLFPAGQPEKERTAPPDAVTPSPPAPDTAAPEPPTPAPPTSEPLSAGLIPSGEAAARIRTAQEVLQSLDSAPSLEDRLAWIADGEKHRDSVAQFFESHAEGLHVTAMDPNVGLFSELPSGEDVKLYVAVTASCPPGAMVRLRSRGGRQQLDWALFRQTHELEFDRFIATAGETGPQWFTVLCARSRTSELESPAQEAHLPLSAQGSLSAQGEARLHVPKDSAAGRLLASRMVWGRVFLTELLIERKIVDGKPALVVQDCAGTATAGNHP